MSEVDKIWWSGIINRISGGDTFAFVELSDKITPKLMAICNAYLKNVKDAEDAVQDVFVLIVRKSGKYRRDENVFGWMYQIARNRCLDILRERRRKQDIAVDCNELSIFEEYEDRITLMQIINKLTNEERELIILRFWGDLPFKSIGKITRQSTSTVQRKIEKIIGKLRAEMQRI